MPGDAVALALLSAVFFGTALVLTPFGLRHLRPLQGAAVSVTTTAAAFLATSPLLVDWDAAAWPAVLVFAGVGALFPAAVTMLTFAANQRLGPHVTGALGNLAPLFAVALAALLLGEMPGPGQAAGVLVVVAGATVLVLGTGRGTAPVQRAALLLPLAAALVRGLVQPAVKIGFETWPSPYAAATVGYLVSAVVVLGLATLRGGLPSPRADRAGMRWFAAVGLCNGAAVVVMYAALARGPVALVAPLVASYPLATLALGAVVLRRVPIGPRVAAGVAVTVAGVALLLASR